MDDSSALVRHAKKLGTPAPSDRSWPDSVTGQRARTLKVDHAGSAWDTVADRSLFKEEASRAFAVGQKFFVENPEYGLESRWTSHVLHADGRDSREHSDSEPSLPQVNWPRLVAEAKNKHRNVHGSQRLPEVKCRRRLNDGPSPRGDLSLHEMEAFLMTSCNVEKLPDAKLFMMLGHKSARDLIHDGQVIKDYFGYGMRMTADDVQGMKSHLLVETDAMLRELFSEARHRTPPVERAKFYRTWATGLNVTAVDSVADLRTLEGEPKEEHKILPDISAHGSNGHETSSPVSETRSARRVQRLPTLVPSVTEKRTDRSRQCGGKKADLNGKRGKNQRLGRRNCPLPGHDAFE